LELVSVFPLTVISGILSINHPHLVGTHLKNAIRCHPAEGSIAKNAKQYQNSIHFILR